MSAASSKTIFVAGASGAIGRVLCELLLADGWRVVGTTRSPEKTADLAALGVEPAVVDVFDRMALIRAVAAAQPEVVVHQLTDLPKELSPASLADGRARTGRLREIGTDNLIAAATAAGVRRVVAQSIAFAYAAGPRPYHEDAPLDRAAMPSVVRLEELVLGAGGLVLRYGRLFGPHTWHADPSGEAPVHVDAAADAARRAVTRGGAGVYNVTEDDGVVSSAKAIRELGWSPGFRVDRG